MVAVVNTQIPIHETFTSIQGEGYWVGTPSDFIRLYGCPVRCHFCDTHYSDGGKNAPRTLVSVADLIEDLNTRRVVITGGEPFIHKDLPRLCQTILDTGRAVSIETSGAFWQEVPDDVWVTLSPKQHISPLFPVQSQMWKRANEIKLVIEDGTEINYYERHLDNSSCPIFLQPEWDQRDRTIPLVFQLLSQRTEMRLSLQIHKFLNLR